MKNTVGLCLIICLMLLASVVYADMVHFKSGRKMEGKIIEESKDKITLKTDYATLTFARDGIASIERKPYVFKEKKVPPKKTTVTPKKGPKKQQPILDKLISIEFTQAPMKAVFDFFSKMTQREVKYDGEVRELGAITIRIQNVSIKEAMDKIARQKGLKYKIKENSIIFSRP